MADVTIAVEKSKRSGLDFTRNGSLNTADTHLVRNNGLVWLYINNTDASQHVATIETTGTEAGYAIADETVTVPAGEDRVAGPYPTSLFGKDIKVTFDDATGMELGAISL